MLKLFYKTKRPFIYLLICTIIVSLASDMGKYAQKNQPPVDYSKFIEEFSEEESVEDVFLDENQRLLKYTVENKNMGYIKGNATQGVNVGETSSYVTAKPFLNYRFVEWSDGVTEAERHDMVWENTEIKAEFEYVGFPELHISVPEVVGEIDKEYVNAILSLSNTEESFSFDNRIAKIKVRGNSSSRFDKKSYKVKFSSKINLLGIGNDEKKDWVLLANHCDQSLLRNFTAYRMAKAFGGFEVCYDSAFVHVYLNGEYNGVYLITEQVEVGKSRVNIETDGVNDDIGFLLELDSRENLESGECIQIDNLRFAIKSDFSTNGQYEYATNYLNKCNEAIKKGDKEEINALFDMDSLVDMYLLQEYVKNFDVGFASLFMYIKENGGKLYFGPAWDFDISMGNDDRLNDGGVEELFAGERCGFGIGHEWFILLVENQWFRELVSERYKSIYPIIKQKISNVVKYYLENKEEFEKNFEKWDIFGERILFEPESVRGLETHKEHSDHLFTWLEERNEWLYEYFSGEDFKNKGKTFIDKIKQKNEKND